MTALLMFKKILNEIPALATQAKHDLQCIKEYEENYINEVNDYGN